MTKQNHDIFEKRMENFLKEYEQLHRKYKLMSTFVINFPRRKNPPFIASVCSRILSALGGEITMRFYDAKAKNLKGYNGTN